MMLPIALKTLMTKPNLLFYDLFLLHRCVILFIFQANKVVTVKPVYSRHAIQLTPCNSRHLLVKLVESRSNFHRKTPIQRAGLQRTVTIADTIFEHCVKNSSQIYLFITDNPFFCEKVKINCYSIFKCVFQMLSNTSLLFCYSSHTSLFSESSRTSRIS